MTSAPTTRDAGESARAQRSGRLRREVDKALDPTFEGRTARLFRWGQGFVLLVGLGVVISGTVPEIDAKHDLALTVVSLAVSVFFAAEYACRAYLAPVEVEGPGSDPAAGAWRRSLRWAISPLAVIDLFAAAPVPLALGLGASPPTARIFGILWILKLVRYAPAVGFVVRVVRDEARALSGVLVAFLIALLVIATSEYLLESRNGTAGFESIPGALWWTIVTISTTGYGDEVPATFAGRVLGGLAMVCGIAMFALWAGIIANGFAQEIRRRDFLETWNLVARMPLFSALGAGTIAEVAMLLRPHEMAAGRTVIRKGQPGDSMYFIASGAVEVQARSGPVKIGAGGFFGEMALITGGPRSATVIVTQRSKLLKLDIVDFRSLTSRVPELIQAINAEAARRGLASAQPAGDPPSP